MFDGNGDMNNVAYIYNFTLQNMTGGRVLINSIVNIFILNWKHRSTLESDTS